MQRHSCRRAGELIVEGGGSASGGPQETVLQSLMPPSCQTFVKMSNFCQDVKEKVGTPSLMISAHHSSQLSFLEELSFSVASRGEAL